MKRSQQSLHFFLSGAAASDAFFARTTIIMSYRPAYRGGRNFSNRPENSGNDHFVSGDPHFQSVRKSNQGYRPVERGNFASHNNPYRPNPSAPPFNPRAAPYQNQLFTPPGSAYYNQNQQFRPRGAPHFHQSQQFRPPQQRPRVSDYRGWEYAKTRPPPDSERFTVLSYNILADYLALDHRNQLYFHIPHYILEWEFRKKNILSELGWWSADILCFQEVDRFHDLEDELKLRGYSGLWKMRTGDPVDGCAIFWRASRFKLLHQEFIEFNKLGLRDNVALICVLESLSPNNAGCPSLPESSAGANKVVICNIHVLYNPRRGEIKLGQVRGLLNKAYAVSKLWDNAPVVICGDFNCTPKSPLYNFIAEQKLNVTELPRDKLSGQASAEIRPHPYNRNPEPYFGPRVSVDEKEVKQNDVALDVQNMSSSDIYLENTPCSSSLAPPLSENVVPNASPNSFIGGQTNHRNNVSSHEMMENKLQYKEDICKDETELTLHCHVSGLNESPSNPDYMAHSSGERDINPDTVSQIREEALATSVVSHVSSGEHIETTLPGEIDIMNNDMAMGNSCSTDAAIFDSPGNASNFDETSCNQLDATYPFNSIEVSSTDTPENMLSLSVANGKESPTICEVDFSERHGRADSTVDEMMEKSVSSELGEDSLDGSLGEDSAKFLSELHADDHLPSVDGTESHKVLDDLSGIDREPFNAERTPYNPSAWTLMEIEKATGSAECTFVEHPIKLKSTYTEVEDRSSTHDSTGEPQVTSYHRRFSGTVDYIWRSEGLQTVRILAPMQRQAMQWTPGFPTKKWGSDHIALVTELAFRKDDIHNPEVR